MYSCYEQQIQERNEFKVMVKTINAFKEIFVGVNNTAKNVDIISELSLSQELKDILIFSKSLRNEKV